MAAAVIGSLRVDLGLNSAAFSEGLKKTQQSMGGLQKTFANIGSKMQGIGANLSLAVSAPLVALGAKSIQAANESKAAFAQVESALASMGGASGKTAGQLSDLAGRLQDTSLFDDDDILAKSTANLLTFGKVQGEVFDRAQQAIVDYATRTGADLQSATIMIGKALNDPLKGLTALSKVGVQFTADQKTMIAGMVESGNTAGAQGVILAELERQYKGAGQAARDASPSADMDQAWRNFQETVGAIAAQVLPPLTEMLTRVLNGFDELSPGVKTFAVGAGLAGIALGPIVGTLGTLVKTGAIVIPTLIKMGAGFTGLATAEGLAAGGATAFGVALRVAMPWLAAVSGAVTAGYVVWKNWDKITAIVARMYEGVKTFLVDKLNAVFDGVRNKVKAVGDAFYNLYDRVVGHSYIPDMVNEVGEHIGRLDTLMVAPIKAATGKVADAFAALQGKVQATLDRLFPDEANARDLTAQIDALDGALANRLIKPEVWQAARARLRTELQEAIRGTEAQKLTVNPFADAKLPGGSPDLGQVDLDKLDGVLRGMTPAIGEVGAAFGSWQDRIAEAGAALSDIMGSIFGRKAGGIIGGILDAGLQIARVFSGGGGGGMRLPGFATGGSFQIQGMRGNDQNILALNQQPIARVSHGEMVNVGRGGGGGGRPVTFDLRGAVMTSDLLVQMSVMAETTSGRVVMGNNRTAALRGRQSLG